MSAEKVLKASELREKSADELRTLLHDLMRERFNLRMGQGSGQQVKTHLFGVVKRNIARVKTVLNEK